MRGREVIQHRASGGPGPGAEVHERERLVIPERKQLGKQSAVPAAPTFPVLGGRLPEFDAKVALPDRGVGIGVVLGHGIDASFRLAE